MVERLSVDDWLQVEHGEGPDGSWPTMMARVAKFHHKHKFADDENHGHDMGFRIALTVEELGELSAAITKGKPDEEAAEELADLVFVTSDNPRSELPEKIIDDIVSGMVGSAGVEIQVDRRMAIAQALQAAADGDVVVLAGKGDETYQILADEVIDFDDRLVACETLRVMAERR